MDVRLRVVSGTTPQSFGLKLPTVIGRSREANLKVPQALVSRQHCELYEEDDLLVVHDLGSSNGTFLDGERLDEPTFFLPGERLRIGTLVLEVEYDVRPDHPLLSPPTEATSEATHASTEESCHLSYQEHDSGSFLGVTPVQVTQSPSRIEIHTEGETQAEKASQSGLQRFLKNLDASP